MKTKFNDSLTFAKAVFYCNLFGLFCIILISCSTTNRMDVIHADNVMIDYIGLSDKKYSVEYSNKLDELYLYKKNTVLLQAGVQKFINDTVYTAFYVYDLREMPYKYYLIDMERTATLDDDRIFELLKDNVKWFVNNDEKLRKKIKK